MRRRRTRETLIEEGLQLRLRELERLVGADALRRGDLSELELLAIAERLDAALEGVTGVSARDRTLVWLHDAIVEVARQMRGDVFTRGAEVQLPFQTFVQFCLGAAYQFPRLRGTKEVVLPDGKREWVSEMRFVGPALGAAAMALHPARRRGKKLKTPEKWTAFRNLAVAERLIEAKAPEDLRRTVRSAKRRLSRLKPPVPAG
ncbi:MAG TPA: hypothetical protein VFK69_07645 [Candidatus Eisenbacteria bacterium]|nr:hypothetical protein [Candidatus Eisenbacteria bacterium]